MRTRRGVLAALLGAAALGGTSAEALARRGSRKRQRRPQEQAGDIPATVACYPSTNCQPGYGATNAGCDYSGSDLFVNRDARGAILVNANFTGADISGTDLRGADLSGCRMTHAFLPEVHLENAFLNRAILNDAQLGFAHLEGATMDSITAVNARFAAANLNNASMADADLRNAVFQNADLRRRDWRRTICPNGVRVGASHPTCCRNLNGSSAKFCS